MSVTNVLNRLIVFIITAVVPFCNVTKSLYLARISTIWNISVTFNAVWLWLAIMEKSDLKP